MTKPCPPINALSPPCENGLGKTLHSNFKCTTVNSISLRQIQIHHVTFAAANLNSLRQFQIRQGHFKFSTANSVSQECTYGLQGECGRGTASVGVGHHLSSIKCEIFTWSSLSDNEFKDFSTWTPLTHFVIQRWRAGIRTRWKIQVLSTPRVKFDCH